MNELKEICQKISSSKPRERRHNPLYVENIDRILEVHDLVFPNNKHKTTGRKVSAIFAELFREHTEGEVECQVCKLYKRNIIVQHVNMAHGLSGEEYKRVYGGELVSDSIKNKLSEKIKGDKNPAYQHGGRLSPFSPKFVKYQDKTDEEIIESIKGVCNKSSTSNRENGNNDTTLIYWTSRGCSDEEAKKEITNRQITFSLEKCIEKYGEEAGKQKWQERQEKWQTTLNSKPIEEIERINQGKSTGRMNQLFNSDPRVKLIPSLLYYIRFYNIENNIEFWKVGITSHDCVSKQFGSTRKHNLKYEVISINDTMTFYDAFKAEQKILNKYKEYRININYNGFSTTEAFSIDVLNNQIL